MVREEQRCRNLKSRLVGLHSVRIPLKIYAKNEKNINKNVQKNCNCLKVYIKITFNFTIEILKKMLVGYWIPSILTVKSTEKCWSVSKIWGKYERKSITFSVESPSILKEKSLEKKLVGFRIPSILHKKKPQKNVGRFQKFGGNTNVNRLVFP